MQRQVYVPPKVGVINDLNEMRKGFMQQKNYRFSIPKQPQLVYDHDGQVQLSIATYNVHMWMNINDNANLGIGQDSVSYIMDVISSNSPDVLFLQEYTQGDFYYGGQRVRASKVLPQLQAMGYVKNSFCNIVPSWLETPVGNAIFLHSRVLTVDNCSNGFKVCEGLQENINVLPKTEIVKEVQGIKRGSKETRCYITMRLRLKNYTFILCNTHLDVSSEPQRLAQVQAILEGIGKEVEEAKKETQELQKIATNRNVTFYDPIIIFGGDFNTINPQEFIYPDRFKATSIKGIENINSNEANLYWKDRSDAPQDLRYIKALMDKKYGVYAYLSNHEGIELSNGDRYFFVQNDFRGQYFTNWNLSKIDHMFIGMPPNGLWLTKFDQFIDPTPSSDHLLLMTHLAFNQPNTAHPISYTPVLQPSEAQPTSIEDIISKNPILANTFEIDQVTGLYLYYPQWYEYPHSVNIHYNLPVIINPISIPKDFGSWNEPSEMPGNQVKFFKDQRRVQDVPDDFIPSQGQLYPRLGKPKKKVSCLQGIDMNIYVVTDGYKDSKIYSACLSNFSYNVERPQLPADVQQIFCHVLTMSTFSEQNKSVITDIGYYDYGNVVENCMYYIPGKLLYITLTNGTEYVQWDDKTMLQDLSLPQGVTSLVEGIFIFQDNSFASTGCPKRHYFKNYASHSSDLNYRKCSYVFYGYETSRSVRTENVDLLSLTDLSKRLMGYVNPQQNSQFEIRSIPRTNKEIIRAHIFQSSFVGHDDDMFQISSGSVNYLHSNKNSTYSLALEKAYGNMMRQYNKISSTDELDLLKRVCQWLMPNNMGRQDSLVVRYQQQGSDFYRQFDQQLQRDAVFEYMLAWLMMDMVQQHCVSAMIVKNLPRYIYTEDPTYVYNPDRDFTLKVLLHCVNEPKKSYGKYDYTFGPSWWQVIDTTNLVVAEANVLKVHNPNNYYIVAPLQKVKMEYYGYGDYFTNDRIYRRQIGTITSQQDINTVPSRVTWRNFRFLVDSETSQAHLDTLEFMLGKIDPSFNENSVAEDDVVVMAKIKALFKIFGIVEKQQ